MASILFIQNGEHDGPGVFADVLVEKALRLDVVHAWRGETIPTSLGDYVGVSIGGGGMSAYQTEQYPFLAKEIALIGEARRLGRPFLGMCLGAQLLAAACGAKVFANRQKEIGLMEVRFTSEAATDPLWNGLTAPLNPVHWHGDTFLLPDGATLLASSDLTPHQLFRIDEATYGFQFHLEIDLPALREMVALDQTALREMGVDPEQFVAEGARLLPGVLPTARAVFSRWADLAAQPSQLNSTTKQE